MIFYELIMIDDIYKLSNEYEGNCFENGDTFLEPYDLNISVFFKDYQKTLSNYISEIEKKIQSTNDKTIQQKDKGDEPDLYTSNDILTIFNKESNKNKISEIFKTLKFRKYIEEDLNLTKKKTRRDNFDYDYFKNSSNIEDNKTKKKRGRQTNICKNLEIHNKMSSDNIIKKVKVAIFNCILAFLNNIINFNNEFYNFNKVELINKPLKSKNIFKFEKLKKINYKKYINGLKKEKQFLLLNMTLKDLFSQDISPKYKESNDYNKKKIEKILKNNVDETILFVFNITLRDWIDIFTLKKDVKDIINEYNNINIENIDFGKIEKCWVGIDNLLKTIKKKNDEDYITSFIICLYNYERWFYIKRNRNYNKNEKKKEFNKH